MSALCHSGCLASPSGPPIREQEVNHWPLIVKETLQPQAPDGVVKAECDGAALDQAFEVKTLVEYDVEQTLSVRWFIDYEPDPNAINSRPFAEQEILGSELGPVEREVNISVRVSLNWLPEPTRVGEHLVELVVSDALPLSAGALPYRSFPPGGLFDMHHWVVKIDSGGCL